MSEQPICRFSKHGANVLLQVTLGGSTLNLLMPPAQTREWASAALTMADIVEQQEGIAGEAHRTAHVSLPAVDFTLPAMSLGG